MCNLTLDHVKIIQCNLDYLDHVYPEPSWLSGQAGDQKIHHHAMHRRYGQWSFVGVVTGWTMSYSKSTLVLTHPWLRSLLTCLGQNWQTRALFWMLLAIIILYRSYLQSRYHKPGEKCKHFSYPDIFHLSSMSVISLWTKESRISRLHCYKYSTFYVPSGNSTIYLSN